jgi:hypothetical protein
VDHATVVRDRRPANAADGECSEDHPDDGGGHRPSYRKIHRASFDPGIPIRIPSTLGGRYLAVVKAR